MRRYLRRASEIATNHGIKALVAHSLRFAAHKMEHTGITAVGPAPVQSSLEDDFRGAGRPNGIGAILARTLREDVNPSIGIPLLRHQSDIQFEKVAVIAHVFYPELMPEMLRHIANIPVPVGLFVSTDTEEKRQAIVEHVSAVGGFIEADVRLVPNRGRDVAPKLIAFRDVYNKYPAFLHLHSKKSPHGGSVYQGWREYLLTELIGSRDIASSNLMLLSDPIVGLVYPEHAEFIKPVINWGYNFDIAQALLERVGVQLETSHVLEFPSGSMFWARSEALKPLLDLGLSWEDFPPEKGQIDGTTAHAIERTMLYFVEIAGFQWRKTTRSLAGRRSRHFRSLLTSDRDFVSLSQATSLETLRILPVKGGGSGLRLNLLVPTLMTAHTFGGIATALRVFLDLGASLRADLRVLVTDASVKEALPQVLRGWELQAIGSEKRAPMVVVDCCDRLTNPLEITGQDIFVATAWWTALNAYRLQASQRDLFGSAQRVIYLIQDYEPGFYGWSSRYTMAESTYSHGAETVAIFNSEELAEFFLKRFKFPHAFVLRYTPNERISAALRQAPREPIILFYSRPTAARNCFEVGLDGIALWTRRNPTIAAKWRVCCIGERFPPHWASQLHCVQITGKMELEDYALLLSRASVGVSLMVSPHPSYPPLEMAFAGLHTVTNNYECKDLSRRSKMIHGIEAVTPACIADAVERAVTQAQPKLGAITPIRQLIEDIPSQTPVYAAVEVIKTVLRGSWASAARAESVTRMTEKV